MSGVQVERAAEAPALSREEQMVVVARDESGKPTIWCDPEVVWLVKLLNDGGVPTVASCSGHGYQPPTVALSDGRVLVVLDDLDALARVNVVFGFDINGEPIEDPKDVEIARLREVVKSAYCEGWSDEHITRSCGDYWKKSFARAELEQKP